MIQFNRERMKNRALRQYALLLSSNIGLVVVGFISSFLLTRYMTMNEYGMYKYTLNTVSTISLISLFGIPYSASLAIVKTNDKARIRRISGSAILLIVAAFVMVSAMLLVFLRFLNMFSLEFEKTVYYAIFTTIALSLQNCFITMYQGSNDIRTISAQTILPSVLVVMVFLFIGLWFNEIKYEVAIVVYFSVSMCIHAITIRKQQIPFFTINKDDFMCLLYLVKEKGLNIYYGSLIGVGSSYLLNMVLGHVVNMQNYATYSFALSMAAPIQQIPSVMGVVLFSESARSRSLTTSNVVRTVTMTFLSCMSYWLVLRFAFIYVFPPEYGQSYRYVIFLSFAYAFYGLGDYLNKFISAHGHSQYIRNGALVSGITNLIISSLGIFFFREIGIIAGRIGSGLFYLLVMVVYYKKLVREIEEGEVNGVKNNDSI